MTFPLPSPVFSNTGMLFALCCYPVPVFKTSMLFFSLMNDVNTHIIRPLFTTVAMVASLRALGHSVLVAVN